MKTLFRAFLLLTTFSWVCLAGEPAAAVATITAGFVTDITVTAPGSGYESEPTVTITGGGGSGATAKAILTGDRVALVIVLTAGSGYSSSPTVTIAAPPKGFGLRIDMVPKLTVAGPAGSLARVEWADAVSGPWNGLSNVVVSLEGVVLVDLTPGSRERFYRTVDPSGPVKPIAVGPVITSQPVSAKVAVGQTVPFSVTAAGTPPITYQWQFNGVNISGAIGATLSIANTQPSNVGAYRVVVKNAAGEVISAAATLMLDPLSTGPAGFVWIPAGTFVMGSPMNEPGRAADEKQHTVKLTQGFWMSDHEVTQAEYEAVMGINPSSWRGADLPVENVVWRGAVQYCERLTERSRFNKIITTQQAFRLPTEAEWEYAARAGTTGSGYGLLDVIAWYGGNSGGVTHTVKTKQPNAWGLYDMLGNVSEWCADWYVYDLAIVSSYVAVDPLGSSGSFRVHRGGGLGPVSASYHRSGARGQGHPDQGGIGFRPVLSSAR